MHAYIVEKTNVNNSIIKLGNAFFEYGQQMFSLINSVSHIVFANISFISHIFIHKYISI